MNNVSLYQRASTMQRKDAQSVIGDYANTIKWRPNGGDRIIDVGCGPGNVLMECFCPILPHNFEELVGSDISPDMVNYARSAYCSDKRIRFRTLDIATDDLPHELQGHFDHVTSFFCLHWVVDQRKALKNIYNLLNPLGGDCLFVIAAKHPIYSVYRTMSKTEQWQPYMRDIYASVSPLFDYADVYAEYAELLSETGFSNYSVELRKSTFAYRTFANVKDSLRAINPFVEQMPLEIQDEYMNEFICRVLDLCHGDETFEVPHEYAVVYAQR